MASALAMLMARSFVFLPGIASSIFVDDLSVTSKGQVTIPEAVRQKLRIRAGSKVQLRVVGDHAELTMVSEPADVSICGFGMLKSTRQNAPSTITKRAWTSPMSCITRAIPNTWFRWRPW